ncbi:MAG TPA: fibronectin type III domain-containing protein [Candidatus Saccharibacteria bacterium]|nr:fibronectin type III domain-containing protein [Candidatus Saccharibacteria bacterium]
MNDTFSEDNTSGIIASHPVATATLRRRSRIVEGLRTAWSHAGKALLVCLAAGVVGVAALFAFSPAVRSWSAESMQVFVAERMTECAQGYEGLFNVCEVFNAPELYAIGEVDGTVGGQVSSFDAHSKGSSTPITERSQPQKGGVTHTEYSKALTGGAASSGTATAAESDVLQKAAHAPQAPGGLRVTASGAKELSAKWNKVDGATQYQVKVRNDKGEERVATTGSNSVSIPVSSGKTTYTVEVEAVNSAGHSKKVESVTTTPPVTQANTPPAPSAVKGVKATAFSTTGIDLSWDSANNATSYIVQRATNTGFSANKKEYLVSNIKSYSISDLQTGVTYYFRVQASNKGTTSGWSSHASATTYLASPAYLKAASSSRGAIALEWAKSGAASSYEVQYSTASNFFLAPSKTTSGTSVTLDSLKDETLYHVRIKAKSAQSSSDWSKSITITTLQAPPTKPGSIKTTVGSYATGLVEWSKADRATSYEVQYTGGGSTTTKYTSSTSLALSGLQGATKYTIKVRASNATGAGEWSSTVSLTTPMQPPSIPAGVTATVNSTTAVTVKWNTAARAERYSLVYSTSSSLTGSTSIANITATSRQVTGLKAGTTYYFAVIAHNAGGNVGSSATISAKTQTTTTPTPAPTPAPAPSTPTPAPAPSTPKEEVSTPAPSKPIGGCYWNPDVKQPSGEMYHIPDAPDPTPYAFSNSPEGVKYAAENKSASGKKYTRIDIDLRVTSDGVIVATHTAAVFGTDKKKAGFVDPKGEYKAGSTKGIGDIPWSVAQRLEHTYNGKKYNIHKVEAIIKQAKASGIALQFELKSSSQWQSKKLLPKLLAAVNKEKVEAYVFTKTTTTDWKQNLDYSSKIGFWTRHTGEDSPWVAPQPTASECNKL